MIAANRPAASALARVTEAGAVAAARAMGHGDGKYADSLAVDAMRTALDQVGLAGRIVIGEGERDEAPMLFIGETVGPESGTPFDIAVDPLEGTNLVAGGLPNAVATMAIAERGGLLNAPDTYMDKLIVGPPAAGRVSLDYSVRENLRIIAAHVAAAHRRSDRRRPWIGRDMRRSLTTSAPPVRESSSSATAT